MENDDKSVTVGLTDSDLEEYHTKYPYVSEEEIRSMIHIRGTPPDKDTFETRLGFLNTQKERETKFGRGASHISSLFMLLSVHVKPRNSSSLSVYGEITSAEYGCPSKHLYIYKRESQDAETFSWSDGGGYLTLNGPPPKCSSNAVHFLFKSKELSIRLFDQQGQCLYPLVGNDDLIILDYSGDHFEQVKEKVVHNTEISLTLKYVSIPMAVYGRVQISIYRREGYVDESKFVNVCGRVVAKYKNTFGNYSSEEIVLFDKKDPEYETLELDTGYNSLLFSSRSWLASPAYSLLHLHFDLLDCQEGTKLTQDVELGTDKTIYRCSTKLRFGDYYYMTVDAIWLSPPYCPRELVGCDGQIARTQLSPAPAIEIFSVFVFNEGSTPSKIYGRLQLSCGRRLTFDESGVDIFKQEEEDALNLSERGNTIPVSKGSRDLDFFFPLSMICDLKATVKDSLQIKGYKNVNSELFDTELCSLFQGVHGFASVHYAIFSSALQATLKVSVCQQKRKRKRERSQSFVSGSICAQYKHFDYSSQYRKNSYEIVLFKGMELMDDKVPLTLSRSSFVVPSYSSPIIYLDLMIGREKCYEDIKAEFGRPIHRCFVCGEHVVDCMLEWCEIE